MTAASKPKPPREIWLRLEECGIPNGAYFDAEDCKFWLRKGDTMHRYVLADDAPKPRKRKAGKR